MDIDALGTRDHLIQRLRSLGVDRVYYKVLQENDNSKQQIYIGDHPGSLAFLRSPWEPDPNASIPKIGLDFSWITADRISPAAHAKLIYYANYPEVRLSGFLKGSIDAPREAMKPIPRGERLRSTTRVLFIGSTPDRKYFAYLSTAEWANSLKEDADGTNGIVKRLEMSHIVSGFSFAPPKESLIMAQHPEPPSAADMICSLPRWALTALLARWTQRVATPLLGDQNEPAAIRSSIADAIDISMERARMGGTFELNEPVITGEAFHDHHDIAALSGALSSFASATSATYEELIGDVGIEEIAFRNYTSVYMSATLLDFAVPEYDQPREIPDLPAIMRLAIEAAPNEGNEIIADLTGLYRRWLDEQWTDITPVSFPQWQSPPKSLVAPAPPSTLRFRPRARIIRTIGDRLISGPEAAVIELVKNSYDADAESAVITFTPNSAMASASIRFEDDGHGMSFDDIQNKWMEPATSDKKQRATSPKGRRLLGSKGIGRFAAARLGTKLRLRSEKEIAKGVFEETTIPSLDWSLFDEREYLEDIEFESEMRTTLGPSGTQLDITHLRDEWTDASIRRLFHELRKLLSPINSESQSFRIVLDLSACTIDNCGFDSRSIRELNGLPGSVDGSGGRIEIGPFPLLSACDYVVDGIFDETGRFEGTFTIMRDGRAPEPIVASIPLHDQEQDCGIVVVKLSIFDREATSIRSTAQKAGFGHLGVRESRKLLDSIAGVAIYRDNFRIRPYGDAENDWLTLDAKRVQNPSLKIGRNQIAGIVLVEDEDSAGLIERSSREGLEENGSFRRLQSLILGLLASEIEPRRRKFRIDIGLETRKSATFRDAIEHADMSWASDIVEHLPADERETAKKVIAHESGRITGYLKELEERQAQLEAQVTLGLIVGEVMHQGNTPLAFIENEVKRLQKWWPSIADPSVSSDYYCKETPRILNGLDGSALALRTLFNALGPLAGARRGPPLPFSVAEVVNTTIYLFKTRAESLSIRFSVDPALDGVAAVGYPQDLTTALTNLIDNALHWLDHWKIRPGKVDISVAHISDENISLVVSDNGHGITPSFADQLFEVGFSMKPNGTGLGLSIAREAIFRSGGELELGSSGSGAAFTLTIPRQPYDA